METIRPTSTLTPPFSFIPGNHNVSSQQVLHKPAQDNAHEIRVKNTADNPGLFKTVADILTEGLKQNFLGADINMEFLILTVRNAATVSVKSLQQFLKPHHIKRALNSQRHHLNQPSY